MSKLRPLRLSYEEIGSVEARIGAEMSLNMFNSLMDASKTSIEHFL